MSTGAMVTPEPQAGSWLPFLAQGMQEPRPNPPSVSSPHVLAPVLSPTRLG